MTKPAAALACFAMFFFMLWLDIVAGLGPQLAFLTGLPLGAGVMLTYQIFKGKKK